MQHSQYYYIIRYTLWAFRPRYGSIPSRYGSIPSGYGSIPSGYGFIPSGYGFIPDCSPRKPGSQIIRGLGLRETLQPQPRPCPELSSSFSLRHDLVQSYLHPSVSATTSSRVIFILQSQPRPRPELSLSFNNIHDLV